MNRKFLIREGMPVPVIFAGPMDAFAQFNTLWTSPNNPYSYLREMEEFSGLQPAPLRVPLISIEWKRMRYRPEQSYSTRVNRRVEWKSVNNVDPQGLRLNDVAHVRQARYPAAWNFVYQVDFYCARPDTQGYFVKQLNTAMQLMTAGAPQCMIPVVYPGYFGYCLERLFISGDIEDQTEKEPQEGEMRYRTSVNLEIEGYVVPQNTVIAPTMWRVIQNAIGLSPADLEQLYLANQIPPPQEALISVKATGAVLNPIVVDRQATMPPPADNETIPPYRP